MQDKIFDVGAFIDNQRISAVQILVMLLCAAIMTVDGYDVFVMGFLLQPIAQSFGVPPAAITSVFVVQSIGLALGTWVVSPLADRYGRRRLLLASTVLFGALTLATTQARSVNELVALRFAAGLFYGSLIPNAIAITVEYAPERLRATMVNWMFIGYTAGAASGGAVAAFLVGKYGWQSAFWVGGLVPLGFAVILYFALPESIRFCVLRNERDPRIPGLLRRIDPALALTGYRALRARRAGRQRHPGGGAVPRRTRHDHGADMACLFHEHSGDHGAGRVPADVPAEFRRSVVGARGRDHVVLFHQRHRRDVDLWAFDRPLRRP